MNSNEKLKLNAYSELARILAAAVVNKEYRTLLLQNPEAALNQGYQGESFALSDEETTLLLSIKADNLPDLAKQFLALQSAEKPL
jgi:hypothetical protein